MARRGFTQGPALGGYLAAVSLGCFTVGTLIGVYDVFWRMQPLTVVAFYAFAALIIGVLPGLILGLPGVLVSAWVRRRFGQLPIAWYWLLGLFNGMLVSIPIIVGLAWSSRTGTVSELLIATFAVAGGCAGVAFFKVEAALI